MLERNPDGFDPCALAIKVEAAGRYGVPAWSCCPKETSRRARTERSITACQRCRSCPLMGVTLKGVARSVAVVVVVVIPLSRLLASLVVGSTRLVAPPFSYFSFNISATSSPNHVLVVARGRSGVLFFRYVFDGRLEEACLFLSRLLDVDEVADVGALTKLVSRVWTVQAERPKIGDKSRIPHCGSVDRSSVVAV